MGKQCLLQKAGLTSVYSEVVLKITAGAFTNFFSFYLEKYEFRGLEMMS